MTRRRWRQLQKIPGTTQGDVGAGAAGSPAVSDLQSAN